MALLIFVLDVESELNPQIHYFNSCLEGVSRYSPSARIYAFIHKVDLVPEVDQRELLFRQREGDLRKAAEQVGFQVHCFATSIWDETLYKAWSTMVLSLVPNADLIERHLTTLCKALSADEVVLFERATFLVISQSVQRSHTDPHRFEKISNIVKQFKLSCSRTRAQFGSMQVTSPRSCFHIQPFTTNTYLMVITSDATVHPALTLVNVRAARTHFEDLLSHLDDAEAPASAPDVPNEGTPGSR